MYPIIDKIKAIAEEVQTTNGKLLNQVASLEGELKGVKEQKELTKETAKQPAKKKPASKK